MLLQRMSALDWFASYLSDLTQLVHVDGAHFSGYPSSELWRAPRFCPGPSTIPALHFAIE